jgi:hypothetical protein
MFHKNKAAFNLPLWSDFFTITLFAKFNSKTVPFSSLKYHLLVLLLNFLLGIVYEKDPTSVVALSFKISSIWMHSGRALANFKVMAKMVDNGFLM